MGTLPRSGSTTVTAGASPAQVWAVLTDLGRAGEWSHENQGGEWLDGAAGPTVGARFRGRNRQGRTRWSRVCEVLAADEPRIFAWRTVPTRIYPDSTEWWIEIGSVEGGCTITQRFEVRKLNPVLDRLFYLMIPAHRDRSEALAGDLRRLGDVAAAEALAGS